MIDLIKACYERRQTELVEQQLAKIQEVQRISLWQEQLYEKAIVSFQKVFPHFYEAILERLPEFRERCHTQREDEIARIPLDICVFTDRWYISVAYDRSDDTWLLRGSLDAIDEESLIQHIVGLAEVNKINLTQLWEVNK